MKSEKLITALLLMLPGLSWAGDPPPTIPEPSLLALLAVGGVAVGAVKFMRRKK